MEIGKVNLNLSWAPYPLPYEPGTHIAFPSHIKDIIKATDKEIGGIILFSKPQEDAHGKLLLANSIFLTAGEFTHVDLHFTLTTITHGSYMVFHTHPKGNHGYQGYSSADLLVFLFYNLKTYKHKVPVHYCLSTGNDIHFTFIDPVVITIIRTLMKMLKPIVMHTFPNLIKTDLLFQNYFINGFFKMLFDAFEDYCLHRYLSSPVHSDINALTELDTISFTPYSGYDKLKGAVNTLLQTERGRIYREDPVIRFIYQQYEVVASKLNIGIFGATPEDIPHILNYIGLFKTTSTTNELFFNEHHHSALHCTDSGKIYNETVPWNRDVVLSNLDPLSPYQGGSLGKVVYFNNSYAHIKRSKLKTRKSIEEKSQVNIEMEPPAIEKYRKSKGRLTRNERREINSRGIIVPPRKIENYEPNINDHALLWNSGTLTGKPFNYRNKAKVNFKNTWEGYLQQRAEANALAKKKPNNNTKKNKKNNKNNGTRRALF